MTGIVKAKNLTERLLTALAHADAGNWKAAHDLVDDLEGADAAWVHANLHREEGDLGNARYWYGHAGRPESKASVRDERVEIAAYLRGAR